ncbi:uncharacterized protein LOC131036686 isoform X5 [Cryptomeria japonica]|uniref:uncharacterized protein LOC131036686 isoform X5 n=1 Tax=Cryptomeria japonica TaxID=3369 RepID=UPI0027D9F904|nr:uncharacterized protein LOC131036686 isoform X5 [Cryptomeria japonica]
MVIMAAIAMVYSRSRILKYSVPLNSVLNPLRFMAFSTMSTPFVTEQHPPAGPLEIYKSKVREGTLKYDPQQEMVAAGLQDLLGQLHQYEKDMENYCARLREWKTRREQLRRELLIEEAERQQKGGLWKIVANMSDSQIVNFFSRKKKERAEPGTGRMVSYLKREKRLDSLVGSCPVVPPAPKGLYLYGNVGCGKTMLMDMFYNATKGVVRHRYRLHFHAAMLDVHARMHKIWQSQKYEQNLQARFSGWIANLPFEGTVKEWLSVQDKYEQELHLDNILSTAADSLLNIGEDSNMEGASVLCFDEIQAVDVFTVVALSGIISRLLNRGIILVATSNRAPEDLNQGQFFWPLNSQSHFKFEKCWQDLTSQVGGPIISTTISVMFGRLFEIPESCNGLARFTFDQLCACPVGAADYIAIAQNFHTVFIANIPTMSMKISDKARRFITLVDELYNHHCRLICTATSSIDDLFLGTDEGMLFDLESFQFETEMEGTKLRRDVLSSGDVAPIASTNEERTSIHSLLSGREEMFAFRRAVSRLIEMQTPAYLEGVRLHPQFQGI